MDDDQVSLIQNISDDFICFICKKKAFVPRIMPCCGKIGCENCIKNILKNNLSCPNCNESNSEHNLAPVHAHLIDTMIDYLSILEQICSDNNKCTKHKKEYEYYCSNCNQPLCSDCLFDELYSGKPCHNDHDIVSIKTKLQNNISLLGSIVDSVEIKANSIAKVLTKLEKSKNNILLELHSIFKNMCISIESKKAASVKPFDNRINQLNELKEQLKKLLQLISSQNSKMLTEIPKILEEAHIIDQKYQQMEPISPDLIILNDMSPQYEMFQVDIPNFPETQKKYSQLDQNNTKFILSKNKVINGNKWRAKIYSNGNTNDKSGYLSVFFELFRGNKIPSNYFYRVEILSNDPTKPNIIKEYNSEFKVNDSWGWNKVAPLDTLLNQKGYLDSKGTLKLLFGIRAETYYQVYKDLQEAVKYEYTKIKRLKKEIEKK